MFIGAQRASCPSSVRAKCFERATINIEKFWFKSAGRIPVLRSLTCSSLGYHKHPTPAELGISFSNHRPLVTPMLKAGLLLLSFSFLIFQLIDSPAIAQS